MFVLFVSFVDSCFLHDYFFKFLEQCRFLRILVAALRAVDGMAAAAAAAAPLHTLALIELMSAEAADHHSIPVASSKLLSR